MKKKDIRLIVGIICAPVKAVARAIRHESTQHLLMSRARERKWQSDWERMHHMTSITNTTYTHSPLYMHLGEL